MNRRLSFSEELMLLLVDDVTGRMHPVPEKVLGSALGGALLLELAFAGRIDNDLENVFHVNASPTGNNLWDEVLADLAAEDPPLPLTRALALASTQAPASVKFALDNLLAKGSLRKVSEPECPASAQRFEKADRSMIEDLRGRIRQLVLSADAVPDPHDVATLGLVEACQLTPLLFSPAELSAAGERLRWMAGLEFINQAMFAALQDFQAASYAQIAEWLISGKCGAPRIYAGGREAVLAAITRIYDQTGWMRGSVLLTRINQIDGFDCPGCAWPHLGYRRKRFEFCENGIKVLASEATLRYLCADFFRRWTLEDLAT